MFTTKAVKLSHLASDSVCMCCDLQHTACKQPWFQCTAVTARLACFCHSYYHHTASSFDLPIHKRTFFLQTYPAPSRCMSSPPSLTLLAQPTIHFSSLLPSSQTTHSTSNACTVLTKHNIQPDQHRQIRTHNPPAHPISY